MHSSLLVVVSLFLSLTTAATSTTCADEAVFQSCLGTTQGMIASYCTNPTDYNCLCQRWTANANCYDSCPNDPGKSGADSTRDTYCNDAVVYGSTTSSSAFSAAVTTSASSTSSAATTTGGVDGAAVKTASSSAAGATKSSAAAAAGRQAAGGLAFVLGGVAVFL